MSSLFGRALKSFVYRSPSPLCSAIVAGACFIVSLWRPRTAKISHRERGEGGGRGLEGLAVGLRGGNSPSN